MPPVAIGAGIAGVGMLAGAFGAQSAANAQAGAANNQLNFQEQARDSAIQAAQPSFGQMAAIQSQYQMSSQLLNSQLGSLQNQLTLYNSASSQAQALMNGQAASTLAPLQQQQALQTQQLKNQLQAQLGSGYAESSAGSMALANLAMQQDSATAQAQQQATSMYLGASQGLAQGINQTYSIAGNLNSQGLSAANGLQQMAVNANLGGTSNVNFNPSISTAGSGSAGMMYAGSALSSLGGMAAGFAANSGSGFNPSTYGGLNGSSNLSMPQLGSSAGYGSPTVSGQGQ